MKDVLHVGIVLIVGLVKFYKLPVVLLFVGLVKHAEHFVQSVVDLSVQEWYLYDDAVMDETVDKGVGKPLGYLVTVVIIRLMVDIKHGHVYISDPVPENIYSHHWNAVGRAHLLVNHVLGVGVLRAEILSEAKGLCLQPCLLQFDEYQALRPVVLADACPEVDAEHGNVVPKAIGVLVTAYLHFHDLFLQQCGENGTGDAFVFHQIFEDGVIDGVCYMNDHNTARFMFNDYSSLYKIVKQFSVNTIKVYSRPGRVTPRNVLGGQCISQECQTRC